MQNLTLKEWLNALSKLLIYNENICPDCEYLCSLNHFNGYSLYLDERSKKATESEQEFYYFDDQWLEEQPICLCPVKCNNGDQYDPIGDYGENV